MVNICSIVHVHVANVGRYKLLHFWVNPQKYRNINCRKKITTLVYTDLQFLQLSLDSIHVFDEGVEVGHIEVHGLQPLEKALVVSKELQPASVEGSDSGLVLGVAERERERDREGGREGDFYDF